MRQMARIKDLSDIITAIVTVSWRLIQEAATPPPSPTWNQDVLVVLGGGWTAVKVTLESVGSVLQNR